MESALGPNLPSARAGSEPSFAGLCGVAPVPASSGKLDVTDCPAAVTDTPTAPCIGSDCNATTPSPPATVPGLLPPKVPPPAPLKAERRRGQDAAPPDSTWIGGSTSRRSASSSVPHRVRDSGRPEWAAGPGWVHDQRPVSRAPRQWHAISTGAGELLLAPGRTRPGDPSSGPSARQTARRTAVDRASL